MPGKEEKSQYPSCNRAFALRMMNPNSYRQGQVSPLDREIQPVVKRPVARSVSSRSDDSPLSVSSSADTSYQDMELYDIDENGMCNGKSQIPLSASFDSAMRPKGDKLPLSPRKTNDEFGMRRSLSSVDGFNQSSVLKRTSPARTSMPARIRVKAKDDSHNPKVKLTFSNGQTSANGKENSQVKRYNNVKVNSAPIKGKSRLDPSPEGRPRTPVNKVVKVPGTRTSELRAKSRVDETKTENDSDIRNQRSKRVNGNHHKGMTDEEVSNGNSSDCSVETVLKLSSPMTYSTPPNSCSSPVNFDLPPSDDFSTKLAEVCQLITEKHPGDFQILETLVTMQTAYEDRDQQVKKAIVGLHERVNELEDKLRNAPNIPSLVVPLLRASNSFQKQLHDIFVSHKDTLNKADSTSVNGTINGYSKGVNPFDEIYMEANSVAEQILSRQNSRRKSHDENQRIDSAEHNLSRQTSRPVSNDDAQRSDIKTEMTNGHYDANTVAEHILQRQNSHKKPNDENQRNGWDQNSSSRHNSPRKANDENGSDENCNKANGESRQNANQLSRQNSRKKSQDDIKVNGSFTKVNGHINGHVTGDDYMGKTGITVNGYNGKTDDNLHIYDTQTIEHLV